MNTTLENYILLDVITELSSKTQFSGVVLFGKLHHSIFWSFRIIEFIYVHFENRVLLKSVLDGVIGVAHFITGHGQTQIESTIFISVVCSLLPKDLTIQDLFESIS